MIDARLKKMIVVAITGLREDLRDSAPHMAPQVSGWMSALGRGVAHRTFTHHESYPTMLMPWWLEGSLRGRRDAAFQRDLVRSSVSGYYFIRLVDHVMDGHADGEHAFLPAAAFFHMHFQRPYHRHFPNVHPFWRSFTDHWMHGADAAVRDGALTSIDREQFVRVAAQKVAAAKVPLAAVCHRYGQMDRFGRWARFADAVGCFSQMLDDVLDWNMDMMRESDRSSTYFLTEGERRRRRTETIAEWVVREGFAWGMGQAREWLWEARRLSEALEAPELAGYLLGREATLRRLTERVSRGLEQFAAVAAAMH
ncbi:MAG TPA: hypothetical protein VJ596_06090 [Gemmatimonadaceae bacterium]|nr:hypothetical protein [Gemmatimonadaceae bacterium]